MFSDMTFLSQTAVLIAPSWSYLRLTSSDSFWVILTKLVKNEVSAIVGSFYLLNRTSTLERVSIREFRDLFNQAPQDDRTC